MTRPADECPYPKPFAADFDACPAYQARQFIPLDTLYQPLEPVLTCRHLETRPLLARHRWYGACAVGDARSPATLGARGRTAATAADSGGAA